VEEIAIVMMAIMMMAKKIKIAKNVTINVVPVLKNLFV
jgi:hypothetical protein